MAPWDAFKGRIGQFRNYVKITEADEIARRYFVMNAFDGSLTMLGIILGTYLARVHESKIIIGAGIGAGLAMGMSGFFGTYMTERAERTRKLKKLERAMVTNLDETVWDNASSFVSIWAALVDGLSPALAAIVAVVPFALSSYGFIEFDTALLSSLVLIASTLFLLGAYLGKISEENIPINGIRMLLVGALTGFFVWLVSGFGGETAVALVF